MEPFNVKAETPDAEAVTLEAPESEETDADEARKEEIPVGGL